ncbi:hypothetical protein MAGR_23410 [Mycolicibacterium agri]|uniref:HTH marR-type domain-containing protein n=2 Tax=Mycolicibacterium agri TaxID=36811 RepID=A0A7I9VZZ8_MYCAG|nr:hypothetical protein MAGR_23410 [Mycolicibacterium agri]
MAFCKEMNSSNLKSFLFGMVFAVSAANQDPGDSVAFLLSQLGHRATILFAEEMATVDLTPPHAGILRAIAENPGASQQAIARQLGLLPSRVVAFVDELEDRGYVERRRNPEDRRLHALHLTASGKKLMGKIATLARQHDRRVTAGLDPSQRDTLRELLTILARENGLTPHVHPGFRTLGRGANSRSTPAG